ncbi:MAG TPA: glycoside hydrolase family 15 protein [Candidatus Binataceae bacterium]|nr:glycoside hydrolase family 15 protein [Candidatus Binataceae bacterium]
MGLRIEDYALIGNTQTAALVGRNGSIDWLCMPRFDSPACFAALLGTAQNGHWSIAPTDEAAVSRRHYRGDTLVLETEFELPGGDCVAVIDFMPIAEHGGRIDLFRIVEGRRGRVPMRMEAVFRFDYGRIVPWLRRRVYGLSAVAGPDALRLRTRVRMRGEDFRTVADFSVSAGESVPFTLTWYPSHLRESGPRHPLKALHETEQSWREWSSRCTISGKWREPAIRSLITLKALTYSPTGGIVAAPTTSLPEWIGSVRNWDYRFCWLRDATYTLYALLTSGYTEEAGLWRDWLLRAIAGQPEELQTMYGIMGDRRLTEFELNWLAGFEQSRPVRIGNAAHSQFQLDVYGEIMDVFHAARSHGVPGGDDAWRVQQLLMDFLESQWKQPDEGIWEVRGPRRQFTHSKVMAWVGADRAVKAVERSGLPGPVERWRALRAEIHADVCRNGFNPRRNAFVQYYGADTLDASVLLIPLLGFLPPTDPRVVSTFETIRRELSVGGLIMRYATEMGVDGLPAGEGAFLPCTFWLADNLVLMGRYDEAREIFERLVGLRNDVGLMAEEYDPRSRRLLGNFPQAFTHVFLINTAHNLTRFAGPAHARAQAVPGNAEARPAGDEEPGPSGS